MRGQPVRELEQECEFVVLQRVLPHVHVPRQVPDQSSPFRPRDWLGGIFIQRLDVEVDSEAALVELLYPAVDALVVRSDCFLAAGFLQQGGEDSLQRPHQDAAFLFMVLAVVDIETLLLERQQLLDGGQH